MAKGLSSHSTSPPPSESLMGRLWKAGMGVFLILLGATFCWYLWASWQRAKAMDAWAAIPAEVVVSEVQPWQYSAISEVAYTPKVIYRFTWKDETYESDQVRRMPIRSAIEEKAQKWVERFPAGTNATAYVNPADPTESVLKKETKAAIMAIWFPFLFVVGGIGILVSAITPRRAWRKSTKA